MSIQIKHLKSAISSLNQKQKKILDPKLLGKNTFSNKILNQWKQSSDNRLRQISSYFRYDESSNNQKPRYSISALKSSKPVSMIKEANIKPLPKISLAR